MDINYAKPLSETSYNMLRKAGYIPIRDRETGKDSYVFKISGDRYPRFHLYVEAEGATRLKWHLHLDNKKHGWGEKRHDADYDGPDVVEENDRLLRWLAHYTVKEEEKKEDDKGDKSVGGFIAKLFG